jgi:hypothetical protein
MILLVVNFLRLAVSIIHQTLYSEVVSQVKSVITYVTSILG